MNEYVTKFELRDLLARADVLKIKAEASAVQIATLQSTTTARFDAQASHTAAMHDAAMQALKFFQDEVEVRLDSLGDKVDALSGRLDAQDAKLDAILARLGPKA